ncbi:MAG: hypothetical protein JRG97_02250 [Deltaproteobacteria bacterium]|nr:hypothetical protein [Deltaproteobacteria bacterium]MBW2139877.1 hypothetical protein [Deltaproteobacteria bacterium]MBW2323206.1 hypothetical protein [Deltaproteobacteria bacterium]
MSGSDLSPRNISNIPAGYIFAFRDFNKITGFAEVSTCILLPETPCACQDHLNFKDTIPGPVKRNAKLTNRNTFIAFIYPKNGISFQLPKHQNLLFFLNPMVMGNDTKT